MKFNNRNVQISSTARIGNNVRIGDNAIIYDNAEVGDDCVICESTVIGEPQNAYYRDPNYLNPPTLIGPGSTIRSHTVIYSGCRLGNGFSAGHHVLLRENTLIGDHCSVGSYGDIEGDVKIGNYCRLHSNIHISQQSSMGDFVWMFPFAVMTNDPYPPSHDIRGAHIGSYSLICVHAVILPGLKVGENCLIGANTTVNRNLPDYSLANGNPATISDLRQYAMLGKGKLYPWMKRFDRGLPWEEIGWEAWSAQLAAKPSPGAE